MDADFQEQYVAAEQAYSASEFDKADLLARPLLEQLEPLPASGTERDATLAWRAFVALLLGHIHLYGKDDVSQSAEFYRLVLASEPPDTLRELAQQGLSEALERSPVIDVAVSAPAAEDLASVPFENPSIDRTSNDRASNDLIRDPFLDTTATAASTGKPEAERIETAMPWLNMASQPSKGTEQPQKPQQPEALQDAQEPAEGPITLASTPQEQEASPPSLARALDSDRERLEAGLLRVHLKDLSRLGSSSAPTAHDDPPKPLPLQKRLEMAWHSLRRR